MDGVSGTEGIFTECKKGAFASPLISKDIMRRPAPPFDAIDRDSRWPGPSCYVFLVFYPILLLTLHINLCQLLFTMTTLLFYRSIVSLETLSSTFLDCGNNPLEFLVCLFVSLCYCNLASNPVDNVAENHVSYECDE